MRLEIYIIVLFVMSGFISGCGKDSPTQSRLNPTDITWRKTELDIIDVYSWTTTNDGTIFAGASSGRIYRSVDDGQTWEQISLGFGKGNVSAMTSTGKLAVFAGTLRGEVFRSTDRGENWSQIEVKGNLKERNESITALAINFEGQILAVTSLGALYVLSFEPGTKSWRTASRRFTTRRHLTDLLILGLDRIIVGTREEGLFQSLDNSDNWTQLSVPSERQHIHSLEIDSRGYLYAAILNDGLYRSTDRGETWTKLDLAVQSFAGLGFNSKDHIFVATSSKGVYRSMDNGDTWQLINEGLPSGLRITTQGISYNNFVLISTNHGVYRSPSLE